MTIKLHGLFTQEVRKAIDARLPALSPATRQGLLTDIIFLSRMGLAPEGANIPAPVVVGVRTIPTDGTRETHFILSDTSQEKLKVVHPKLAQCVELAITYSLADFRVQQGLRSIADQRKAVAEGHSRTMKSKHLKQADGFVWAVDLVVLTGGAVDWIFEHYANVALAMDKAATELGIAGHIRWGCAWDRVLSDFGGVAQSYLDEAHAYSKRHLGSDLLDAPHFEWVA